MVKNIKRVDTSKLDGLIKWLDMVLHKYQDVTRTSDRKIVLNYLNTLD